MESKQREATLVAPDAIGPRPQPQKLTCKGCPALKTEWWKDYLDNDETDSGTSAKCGAADNAVITAYWHETDAPPSWCPARSAT